MIETLLLNTAVLGETVWSLSTKFIMPGKPFAEELVTFQGASSLLYPLTLKTLLD